MNELFTWEVLQTMGGSVLFVTMFTEFLKYLFPSVQPKYFALAGSFLIIFSVQFFYEKNFTVTGIVLALFNMVTVFCGSVGCYEVTVKTVKNKIAKQN